MKSKLTHLLVPALIVTDSSVHAIVFNLETKCNNLKIGKIMHHLYHVVYMFCF